MISEPRAQRMSSGEPGKERKRPPCSPKTTSKWRTWHLWLLTSHWPRQCPVFWELRSPGLDTCFHSCLCLTLAWAIFCPTSPTLVLAAHRIPPQLGTEISDGSFFPLRVSESSSFPIGFFSALKTVTPAHRGVCVCDMVSGVVQETISNTVASSWQHVRCKISVAGEPRVLGQVWLHLTAVLVQTGRTWTE